jgi:hypothetical protein
MKHPPPPPNSERVDLDKLDCMMLLAAAKMGHLGHAAKALPVITPIRYGLFGQTIVFATGCLTELNSARNNTVACVQISGFDPSTGTEWMVIATGRLRETDAPAITEPNDRPLPPAWGTPDARHVIALDIELLDGCAGRRGETLIRCPSCGGGVG